jgi:hypothetical protein
MTIGSGDAIRLRPTFRDGFMADGGSWEASVVFHRDANREVIGLSVGDDRTWGIRFSKLRTTESD